MNDGRFLVDPSVHSVTDLLAFGIGFIILKAQRITNQDSRAHSFKYLANLLGAIFGAVGGAFLIGGLENPKQFFSAHAASGLIRGKSIVGGIAGGIVGVELAKLLSGETERTGDRYVFPLIVGMIVGRVGCFMTGFADGTVGLPTSSVFGLDQGDGILRHPTSLYEICFLIAAGIFLYWCAKRKRLKSGSLFRLFVILYFSFRFIIEFIKPRVPLFAGLSSIQLTCLGFLLFYLFSFKSALQYD